MAKSGISMQIIGLKDLIKNLEDSGERGKRAVGAGLYLEANNIMRDSKKEAPIDIGNLKNSGYVTLPNISGNTVTVEIGYGGPAKEYAEIQHERTDFKHPEGGKAKYLQDPLNTASNNFSKNVTYFTAKAFTLNQSAKKRSNIPTDPNTVQKKIRKRKK